MDMTDKTLCRRWREIIHFRLSHWRPPALHQNWQDSAVVAGGCPNQGEGAAVDRNPARREPHPIYRREPGAEAVVGRNERWAERSVAKLLTRDEARRIAVGQVLVGRAG